MQSKVKPHRCDIISGLISAVWLCIFCNVQSIWTDNGMPRCCPFRPRSRGRTIAGLPWWLERPLAMAVFHYAAEVMNDRDVRMLLQRTWRIIFKFHFRRTWFGLGDGRRLFSVYVLYEILCFSWIATKNMMAHDASSTRKRWLRKGYEDDGKKDENLFVL